MSDSLGTYAFLPWLRRGIASAILRADGAPGAESHAAVPVTVSFNAGDAPVTLRLSGPGEVTSIDPRVIVRTWPPANAETESNYFVHADLAEADLPWRYSPAHADASDRLRPWICLIVLAEDEIGARRAPGADRPLPTISPDPANLPRLDQSWAWAHVQVSGVRTIDSAAAARLLAEEPHRLIARLLAPRRLDPHTRYRAFIVPVFRRGVLAGLGTDVPDTVDSLEPAWPPATGALELPVYHEWSFRAGAGGDFRYLVNQLRARPAPPEVGIRAMDVSDPAPEARLGAAASHPLGVEGALKSPQTQSTPWDPAERKAWIAKLQPIVNAPAELLEASGGDAIVAPPLYGRWHAARDRLDPGAQPPWFQELSSDPRHRVAAGIGTRVVQREQRPLLTEAWRQAGDVRRANEELRRAQAARELSRRLRTRNLQSENPEALLQVTSPLLSQIKGSPVTIAAVIDESPIPPGLLQPQFRRVTRPAGAFRKRQNTAAPGTPPLLARVNDGRIPVAPAPQPPAIVATLGRFATDVLKNGPAPGTRRPRNLLQFLLELLRAQATRIRPERLAGAISDLINRLTRDRIRGKTEVQRLESFRNGRFSGQDIRTAPPRRDFVPTERIAGVDRPRPQQVPPRNLPEAPSATAFRGAAAQLFDAFAIAPLPAPPLFQVNLTELGDKVFTAIDPGTTIPATITGRLHFVDVFPRPVPDPIEPILAAPEFHEPMYRPLRSLSQDWVLPGLEHILTDTVSLLKTNQAFVEAYMAGLNHEMARELLWNEFPTDQRGSYFRQFWDVSGHVPRSGQTVNRESLKDIKPMHTWARTASLGQNSSRVPPPGGEHLVFLIRGEIFRRYPNAMVYAARTVLAGGKREIGTEERHPVFSGTLPPDVSFFGFDLSAEEVRGTTNPTGDQGWWLVIQEQPGEPRFGLAEVTTFGAAVTEWSKLAWQSLAASESELSQLSWIDLDADLPNVTGVTSPPSVEWHVDAGTTAAQLAFITLRRPARVAWHGSDMLGAATG